MGDILNVRFFGCTLSSVSFSFDVCCLRLV